MSAIVLTSNEDAASKMLTWNGLEGIIPTVDYNTVAEYKCALHAGSFVMDWSKDLNMEWNMKALQIAATVDPRHKHFLKN